MPPPDLACGVAANPECSPRGGGGCCRQGVDVYGLDVELAIRQVQRERPNLFNGDRFVSQDASHQALLAVAGVLAGQGYCVKAGDPVEDEIAIKKTNEFSEQYDLIIGDGVAVNIHGYVVTCRPARF
jgi:hypothetical protein